MATTILYRRRKSLPKPTIEKPQSAALTLFYEVWMQWIVDGAWEGKPFYRHTGLCSSFEEMLGYKHPAYSEMRAQFKAAGLSTEYPFNGTAHNYRVECITESCHLNEERIQWVLNRTKS